jgi:hypothetical protein
MRGHQTTDENDLINYASNNVIDYNCSEFYTLNSQNMGVEFCRKFKDKINWLQLSFVGPREDLFPEFSEKIEFFHLRAFYLSLDFIERHFEDLDIDKIITDKSLPLEFLEKYADSFSERQWQLITVYQSLDDDFIKKHPQVVLNLLSVNSKVSPEFVEENFEKLDALITCKHRKLSENLINTKIIPLLDNFPKKCRFSKSALVTSIVMGQNPNIDFWMKYHQYVEWEELYRVIQHESLNIKIPESIVSIYKDIFVNYYGDDFYRAIMKCTEIGAFS